MKVDKGTDLQMLLLLGKCEESRGQHDRAKQTYERAVKLEPSSSEAAACLERAIKLVGSAPAGAGAAEALAKLGGLQGAVVPTTAAAKPAAEPAEPSEDAEAVVASTFGVPDGFTDGGIY